MYTSSPPDEAFTTENKVLIFMCNERLQKATTNYNMRTRVNDTQKSRNVSWQGKIYLNDRLQHTTCLEKT